MRHVVGCSVRTATRTDGFFGEMHTSLYEEVGSKYGLERGDSVEGRNVSHLSKRDYIRKLSKDAKQAEKAVKGLQTMTTEIGSTDIQVSIPT